MSNFFNKGQMEAFILLETWFYNKKDKSIFRLGGEPGTGKTQFIVGMINKLGLMPHEYLVMSYTGQACSNLIQRGITAKTIHSSILERYLKAKTIDGIPIERGGIPVMIEDYKRLDYISPKVKLLIVDEASFLPEWLETYLLMYGVKIVEVGDPDQLPPVGGKQVFTHKNLTYMLTEPMRQEEDSMIHKLTMDIRYRRVNNVMDYHNGKDVIIIKDKLSPDLLVKKYQTLIKHSDMVLTVGNKQRQIITDVSRKLFLNTDDPKPQRGERLVCRRNNYNQRVGEFNEFPLVNGTVGRVINGITASKISHKDKTYTIDFMPTFLNNDYYDNLICDLDFLTQSFGEKIINKYSTGNKLEYAQALTVHLSQGAQYDTVVYFGGWFMDEDMTRRINHVATSRAKKQLIWFDPF